MFLKNKEASKLPKPVTAPKAPPSIISSDLHVVGDLSSEGELHIDGVVDGDIRGRIVLVGVTANIKGEIVADILTVHGTISGLIRSRSVNLAKTAHVTGDILHEDLSIQTGAFLEGHCKRIAPKREGADGKIGLIPHQPDSHDAVKKPPLGTTKIIPQVG